LAQERPYRDPLPPEEIIEILRDMAKKGKLNTDIVEMLASDLYNCQTVALAQDSFEYQL
jgi:HD-GYP domain-containing protein (c-di-GMP phosphodiesterase class II)